MKNHVKLAILTSFLILTILIGNVKADLNWVEDTTERSGSWDIAQHDHWKSGNDAGESFCDFEMHNLTSGFAIYDAYFLTTHIEMDTIGELRSGVMLDFGTEFPNGVRVRVYWIKQIWGTFWGLQGTVHTTSIAVSKLDNYEEPENIKDFSMIATIRIVLHRSSNDTLTLKIVALKEPNATSSLWSFERSYTLPSNVFTEGYLELRYAKTWVSQSIRGWVEGIKWNEYILADGSIVPNYAVEGTLSFWDSLAQEIWGGLQNAWNGLTSWFAVNFAWLGDIYAYLSFGFRFIVSLFNMGLNFLPLFFGFYGIWLLGICIQSVNDGSFSPIWEHFQNIYHFFANLISMIVNVAQTIWNYIKFW